MSMVFDELYEGLHQAIEIERGTRTGRKTVYEIRPVRKYGKAEIKKIRCDAGMTQTVFADYMGVSPKTVEAWEKGTNRPSGSACRLMDILEAKLAGVLPFVRIREGKM